MTNNITSATAPPAPDVAPKDAQNGPQATNGQHTSPFLALLAMLGNAQPAAGADGNVPLTSTTKKKLDDTAPTKAMPTSATPIAPLHSDKHHSAAHHNETALTPPGVVQGMPILPMPIIIGTPPTISIGVEGKGTPTSPTVGGVVTAHPILGDIPEPGVGGIITEPILAGSSGKSPLLSTASPLPLAPRPSVPAQANGQSANTPSSTGIGENMPLDLLKAATPPIAAPTNAAQSNATQGKPTTLAPTAFATATSATAATLLPSGPPLPWLAPTNGSAPSEAKADATATIRAVAPLVSANNSSPTSNKPRSTGADFATLVPSGVTSGASATQPTSIGAPTAPAHPAVANAAHQIVAQAQLLHNGQSAEMRLHLRPPDLGEVNVTVRRDADGGLTVHLVAATREATSALNANMHFLRASLDQHSHGRGAEVTLGQHDSAGSSPQHGRNHPTPGQENDGGSAEPPLTALNKIATTPAPPSPSIPPSSSSTVDYDA